MLDYDYPDQTSEGDLVLRAFDKDHDYCFHFLLVDAKNNLDLLYGGFKDFRNNKVVTLLSLRRKFTPENYRFMWRGLRYLCATMLTWDNKDPKILFPEHMDSMIGIGYQQVSPHNL